MSVTIRTIDTVDDPPAPTIKTHDKSLELYQACLQAGAVGKEYTISDLGKLNISSDPEELRNLCQNLLDCQLFVPYTKKGVTIYRTRSSEVALKLSKLSGDVILIYNNVAGTGRTGIWKKTLAEKTNLHDMTVVKGIKELIGKKLVKEFRSAKNATKRMYILHELEPSEESTGGAFYMEGELDEGLVNILGGLIINVVEEASWDEYKPANSVGKSRRLQPQPSQLFPEHYYQIPKSADGNILVHHVESFNDYPSAENIKAMVLATGVLKDMELKDDAIARVITMLLYDGQLQQVVDGRYRTTRRLTTETNRNLDSNLNPRLGPVDYDENGFGVGTGLTEVPCDRGPLAKDCRPGGIVSPDKCRYMEAWLEDMQF
jgi:DNA-directed RNA polymerase III subunit RPC6